MTALQILNKALKTRNIDLLVNKGLTVEHFFGYEDEWEFITNHIAKYKNVPDMETFLARFTEFSPVEVSESDDYLLDSIKEEYLYRQVVPILQKSASLVKEDSNAAAEYLLTSISNLEKTTNINTVDIMATAKDRLEQVRDAKTTIQQRTISTGFKEIDEVFLGGLYRGEDFITILARTGQGKSWLLSKILSHAWRNGEVPGLISPEMSPTSLGYRIDTTLSNISNRGLTSGNLTPQEFELYEDYIFDVSSSGGFYVSTQKDFSQNITVPKLRDFVMQNNLTILGIDGLSYVKDVRGKHNDNLTTAFKNVCEDLMALSCELGIPVVSVVQANRTGISDDYPPKLDSIRDSDAVAHSASRIISIKQGQAELEIEIQKNRHGESNQSFVYDWDIDKGDWKYREIQPMKKDLNKFMEPKKESMSLVEGVF